MTRCTDVWHWEVVLETKTIKQGESRFSDIDFSKARKLRMIYNDIMAFELELNGEKPELIYRHEITYGKTREHSVKTLVSFKEKTYWFKDNGDIEELN